MGGARQAARHGLDPGRRPGALAVRRRRRRAMAARSIRWRRACCRSPWARRPRPSRSSWTAARNIASPCASARRARPRTARARSSPTSDVRPTDAAIRAALAAFTGEIEQVPPAFSALKIDGKRAYDLARAGEAVDLKPRQVMIESLELLARPDADHADFVVSCGKGTYIRSLGRDLARALGTVGHCRRCVEPSSGRSARRRPFRFPNWKPSGIFRRFSGPWSPSRPRWTTSRRWP